MDLIHSLTHSNSRHHFSGCLVGITNSHDLVFYCYFYVVDSSYSATHGLVRAGMGNDALLADREVWDFFWLLCKFTVQDKNY